jgi:TRAP-type C4-dicarboxylate transport system substrate-binding protein
MRTLITGLLCGSAIVATSATAMAQETYTLRLSHFLPPVHQQHETTFLEWQEELAERSDGRLQLEIFPAGQMGGVAEQYNLARRGDADIAFVLHGLPAGRFPLVELTHLPGIFDSAEQASQVLMELVPEYLAEEHRGVRILYLLAHAPGHVHTSEVPVHEPSDLEGLRIRHPSSVVSEILEAWGATPQGLPPGQIAESLDTGVIDGLVMPYDGVYGFRLGNLIANTTELGSYINTFAVVMNPDSYDALPEDLQQIIDETTGIAAARLAGQRWDAIEVEGREYMESEGVNIIELSEAEQAAFTEAASGVIEARLEATEEMGLPAREFYDRMLELAEQYAE